jgi:ribosome biogenesis GTPase
LWDISASDLALYFQEFNGFQCAFADCTHDHEPGCGVKAAVEAGEIAASRYQSYLRILNAL